MVGHWVFHLKSGTVFHDDIAVALALSYENFMGWVFHYLIGLIYGVIFVVVIGELWPSEPTFMPVWLYAIVTISAGWFLLSSGLGLGMALANKENLFKG